MGQPGGRRQGLANCRFGGQTAHPPWLIILNLLGLLQSGQLRAPLSLIGLTMRFPTAILTCLCLLAATAASADSRVFIIANQADSYGVDQCLAKGEKCGAHAARSYCQSRDFAQAVSYRRVDPDEITGSIPKAAGDNCNHAGCNEYVASTCQR